MRDYLKIGITLLTVSLVGGCATNMSLTPQPSGEQNLVYDQGRPAIVSTKTDTVYLVLPATGFTTDKRPQFVVAVKNNSDRPFNFSEQAISVIATKTDKDGKTDDYELPTYSYEYLVKEAKRAAAWESVAVALQGAADSYNASMSGYSYNSGTVNTYSNTYGSGYGNSYTTTGYGSYSGTTYNSAAAYQNRMAAQEKNQRDMDRVQSRLNAELSSLAGSYLKKQTVQPGMTYGGEVAVKKPSMPPFNQKLLIKVNVDGEIHEFNVTMDKSE